MISDIMQKIGDLRKSYLLEMAMSYLDDRNEMLDFLDEIGEKLYEEELNYFCLSEELKNDLREYDYIEKE